MAKFINIEEENSIKSFFDENSWQKLSVLEKKRFLNMKRNFDVLESLGLNPKRPEFMTKKKKNRNDRPTKQSSKEGPKSREAKIMPDEEASCSKVPDKKGSASRPYDPKEFEPVMERLKELNEARKKGKVVTAEKKRLLEDMAEEMCRLYWSDHKLDVGVERKDKLTRLLAWSEESMRSLMEQTDIPESGPEKETETVPVVAEEPEVSGGRSRRYPRRNQPKICYREEEVSSEDDYLYCEDCGQSYEGHCPVHGPMILVEDKEVLPGKNSDRAKETCPSPLLSVCRSGIRGAGLGVWTERGLDKGLVFGPYKGKIVENRKEAEAGGYSWVIRRGGRVVHFIDGSDPSTSNWLRYVNCAPLEEDQNLIAFQYRGQVFYRTYKPVLPYTELLVWYGPEYARDLGIQVARGGGACGSSTSRSGVVSFPRLAFAREEDVEGATSCSDVCRSIRERRKAALQTTAERRPTLPGVAIPLDAEDVKKKVFTCFRCDVKFDAYWKLSRHKKRSHGREPEETAVNSTTKNKAEAACPGRKSQLDGKSKRSDDRHEDEGKKKSTLAVKVHDQTPTESQRGDSKSTGTKPRRKSQCGGTGVRENSARKERKGKYHDCPHCEYRTTHSGDLKDHVNAIHSGAKPYPCPHCPYRATQSANLKRHVTAVHLGEKPHRCPHCEYQSAQSTNLKQHVSESHLGERPHPCPHCEYRAATSSHLKKHVSAIHLGQKPFKCAQCDYRSAYSSDLKRHVSATHLNQKPHQCPLCEYRSASSSNLMKHVRTVHGQPKPAARNSKSDGPRE